MPPPIVTTFVASREEKDCAIASIAMYTGASYEDVLRSVVVHDPRWQGRAGLGNRTIRAILAELGTPVRLRRTVDYATDYGLLRLWDHLVLLRNGLIVENLTLSPPDTWRKDHGYAAPSKVKGIFVAVGS